MRQFGLYWKVKRIEEGGTPTFVTIHTTIKSRSSEISMSTGLGHANTP